MLSAFRTSLSAAARVSRSPLTATADALACGALASPRVAARWQSASAGEGGASGPSSSGPSSTSSSSSSATSPSTYDSDPVRYHFYDRTLQLSVRERQVYTRRVADATLPSTAEHGYVYGFTEDELTEAGANDLVRRALSTRAAGAAQLRRFRKDQLVRRLGKSVADTGNSRVQIAMLTDKISRLSAHQAANRQDKAVGRSLQVLSSRRRKLLQYTQRTDFDGYRVAVRELGLRPVPIISPAHPPKVRTETHRQINERNRRLKKRASRGDRGH